MKELEKIWTKDDSIKKYIEALEKERDEWKDRSDCFEDNLEQATEELQTLKDKYKELLEN